MKKSLSLLLALTLVFSMFASYAFAADLDANAKFEALKAAGIMKGYPDGTAGLEKEMTRAEFAVVLTRAFKLELDKATAASYKDKGIASHWAAGEIGAVTKAGIMTGANGFFNPKANITVEQLAKTLVVALGLKPVVGAKVEGTSTSWNAAEYVQAAIDAKLLAQAADYKVNATRGTLVEASYAAVESLKVPEVTVKGAKAVDAKNIEVTFVVGDAEKVEKYTLEKDLVPGVATEVTVKYEGKEYKATVTLAVAALDVTQTGAKKLVATFGTAIDTTKVKFEVKNGTQVVNVKTTTPAEDKKSVTLEFYNDLQEVEYTINVTGVSEKALTDTVKAQASKVTKIEFLGDKFVIDRALNTKGSIGYKVTNQFGDDVTKAEAITVTNSKVSGNVTEQDGLIEVTAGGALTLDEKVVITALHEKTQTFASTTAVASGVARIASIDVVKLEHAADKELKQGATPGDFKVQLEFKDQYGNVLNNQTWLQTYWTTDVVVNLAGSTLTLANLPTVTDGKVYLALNTISGSVSGKTVVTVISLTTGNKDSIELDVKEANKVDSFTMTAPELAVAGEEIAIPYTALDQYGKAVDHPTGNSAVADNGSFTTLSSTNGSVKFVKDVVKNQTTFYLVNPTKGTALITAITKSNKVVQLSVNVVDAKQAVAISGIKDLETSILKTTGSVTIAKGNVLFKDQYGRDITPTFGTSTPAAANTYRVVVTTSDSGKVSIPADVDGNTVNDQDVTNADSVVLSAVAKGSSNITLALQVSYETTTPGTYAWKDVSNSSYTFAANTVEKGDIVSVEATVDGTLFTTDLAGYDKALKVKGVLADGSKVTIPNNTANFEVRTNNTDVNYDDGTGLLEADDDFVFSGTATDADVTLTIILKGLSTASASATAKVSKAASVATTLALKDEATATVVDGAGPGTETVTVKKAGDGIITVASDGINLTADIVAVMNAIVEVKDQYGVVKTGEFTTSNVYVNATQDGQVLTDLTADGEWLTVTGVLGTKAITVKVVVKN